MLKKFALAATTALLFANGTLAQEQVLNLYSARHYSTDEALYTNFTKATLYESTGLLRPDAHSPAGYRLYARGRCGGCRRSCCCVRRGSRSSASAICSATTAAGSASSSMRRSRAWNARPAKPGTRCN